MIRSSRRIIKVLTLSYLAFCISSAAVHASDSDAPDASALRAYHAGNGFLQRGLNDLAAKEYRNFLAAHATHEKAAMARYGLAVSLFRIAKYDDATKELEILSGDSAFAFAPDVLTLLGQCQLLAGHFDDAAAQFRRVVEDHAEHKLTADAAVGLAEALYKAGKHDESAKWCAKAMKRWPDAPQAERLLLFAGLADMSRADFRAAAAHFEKLLGSFVKSASAPQATLLLAQCHQQMNQLDEAAKTYRDVLKEPASPFRPEALFGLAVILLHKGQADAAGPMFDELLDKYPSSAVAGPARMQRGRVYFEQQAFDKAFAAFEDSTKGAAADSADEAAYWMAKCELNRGDFNAAAGRLLDAIKAYPKSKLAAEMAYDRIVALVRSGKSAAALDELKSFGEKHPDHALAADALELLATTLHHLGKYDESQTSCGEFLKRFASHTRAAAMTFLTAENDFLSQRYNESIEEYRRFLDRFGRDEQAPMARCRLGLSLYYDKKAGEALPLLVEAAAKAKTDARLRPAALALGDVYFERSDWTKAESAFKDYLSFDEKIAARDDALLKVGLSQQRQGRSADALKQFDRLLSECPESAHRLQATFERGQALLALKKPKEAGKAFDEVLAAGPSRFAGHARNHLSALALNAGDFKRANELLSDDQADETSGADALFYRGQVLMGSQDFPAAEQTYAMFLKEFSSDERSPMVRAQRAIAIARQKRFDDALAEIAKVAIDRLDPSLQESVLYEKAWCQRESGKTKESADTYRKLIETGGKGPLRLNAMLELAALEADAKKFSPALDLLQKLLAEVAERNDSALDTVREQGTYRLGICQFELGQFADSANTLEQFIRRFAKSGLLPSANYYAGEAFFRQGKHEKAVERFEQSLSNNAAPTEPAALLRLGESLAQLQRWPRSEAIFAKYLKQFPDSDGWYQASFGVAWARENQGRPDDAITLYRNVVEKHKGPTAARAQFQIGECLFAKKLYDEAVRELLKVDILYSYPEWSAAALYEAGRCFEKLSKSAEAREQFKAVVEKHAGTNWAKLASQRLAEPGIAAVPGHTSG